MIREVSSVFTWQKFQGAWNARDSKTTGMPRFMTITNVEILAKLPGTRRLQQHVHCTKFDDTFNFHAWYWKKWSRPFTPLIAHDMFPDRPYYDRHAKPLKGLELEERVRVTENGSWAPAVVPDIWSNSWSYVLKTERTWTWVIIGEWRGIYAISDSKPWTHNGGTFWWPTAVWYSRQDFSPFLCLLGRDCKSPGVAELSSLLIGLINEHLACVQGSVQTGNYVFFSLCANIDINYCSALSFFISCAILFISMGRGHVW